MAEADLAKTAVRTMKLLEALASEGSLGITDLSAAVGLHKSTSYRLVNTLRELGYVRQDPATERYSLTLRLFELGSMVLSRLELWQEARPIIERLSKDTRETVHLATLDRGEVVYLDKVESTQTLRVAMMSRVGMTAPTYCTGVGKILLAFAPQDQLEAVISDMTFEQFTENTITDKDLLRRELATIRQNGYAIDDEEHERGVRCVAAPIHDWNGEVAAALSISVPTVRMTNADVPAYREKVLAAATEIHRRLGGTQAPEVQTTRSEAAKTEVGTHAKEPTKDRAGGNA